MLIGEVSERSGISARMLRHYDRIGLVTPRGRTSGGYREYSADDVRRLFHVEALRSLGLSLQEVARVLDDLAFDPGPLVEQLVERTRTRIAQEQELLDRLTQVSTSNPAAWSDVLRTIGLVRGLAAGDASDRQRLALGLVGRGDDDVGALTAAVLDEAEPNVLGALSWALARGGDAAVPALAQALGSSDPERRRRAVVALEKIGSVRARDALADASGADPFVRARATLARAVRGDVDAVPRLVALVVEGRDDVEAADALGRLASRHDRADEVVREVSDALGRADAAARRRLTAALAEVPGRAARAALGALVDDADRGVALTAAALLRARPHRPGPATPG